MCTALSLKVRNHYFGRNLDLDCSYGEKVCVLPRNLPLHFRKMGTMESHDAMIGMAVVAEGEALFYDAANEHGLCMAGLNFPGNAHYFPELPEKDNVTPFELIPWILGRCTTVREARACLDRVNLVNISFSKDLPLSPLHWMISDGEGSVTVEPTREGLRVYENPVGVMTNNPPFPYHMMNLNNYRGLQVNTPENRICPELELDVYCQGLGALGLPGDVSSMSRFVRMVFNARHSVCRPEEGYAVSRFFHLLDSTAMIRGACQTDTGQWDMTVYSACINASRGRYYYTTYNNRRICCVDMHRVDLEGKILSAFPLQTEQDILYQG